VARSQVAQKRERVQAASSGLAAEDAPATEAKLKEVTGKSYAQWFSILDRWGASDKKHSDTVEYLMGQHDITGWWAQTITNGFERARGIRGKHQKSDGYTIYASKTLPVSVNDAYQAFVDARKRKQWLTDGTMRLRNSQDGKTARFDWDDGTSRVAVTFEHKGASKTTVSVSHERLEDRPEAEKAKSAWRQRLADLKEFLES
jgi:uncharacterized protein YndB with AHSA1/START domain